MRTFVWEGPEGEVPRLGSVWPGQRIEEKHILTAGYAVEQLGKLIRPIEETD